MVPTHFNSRSRGRAALLASFGGLAIAAAPIATSTLDAQAARLGAREDVQAKLDAAFARYASNSSPGCAVGIATASDTMARAYGMAELEHAVPATPSTIYEAGSVSKQVTAAAIVLLALDGRVSLDDDVRKYVPELPAYEKTITLRHLLNHTSGLRDWGSVSSLGGWPRGTRAYNNNLVVDIASRQRQLNYTPGAHYSYTNTGYNLLAVIVARVSGESFAEFTRKRIFVPLGMTQSSWRDDFTRIVPGRAAAYSVAGNTWRLDMPFENAHGNGGMLTTVHDLLRFTSNLETGRVGGTRFIEEMHRQAVLTSGRTITYASGIVVADWRGVREVSHSGSTAGYRAYLARVPEQHAAVAVLCNAANANATAMARQSIEAVVALQPIAAGNGVRTDSASVARYVGTYRSSRFGEPVRLVWRDGRFTDGGGAVFIANGDRRYTAANGNVVQFDAAASARRPGFYMLTRDDSTRYEPVEAFTPTASQLAAFAGTYTSAEAEATYTVVAEGDVLSLRNRYGVSQRMLPAYRDAFTVGGTVITFVRDGAGKVVGYTSGSDRVWSMRFDRR